MTSPFVPDSPLGPVDLFESDTADLTHGYAELCEAREIYLQADAYYGGSVEEVYASDKIRRMLARSSSDEIHQFNYAKIPVDTVANRLQIEAVVAVPPEDERDLQDQQGDANRESALKAQNVALHRLWEDNELDAESKALHKNVSTHGDAYILVWPITEEPDRAEYDEEPDDEEDYTEQDLADEAQAQAPTLGTVVGVDIRVNNASQMRAIYDDEDPLKIAYVIKSWPVKRGGKERHRVNLYYEDRIEKWVSDGEKDTKDPAAWALLEEMDNPYGRVPVFHFRNDRPYGNPEHLGAYGPQDMINKLVQTHGAAIEFQSFPQRYLMVDPTKDDPTSNSDDPIHPDDDAEDPESELGDSGMSAEPGSIWKLWGASTGEYQPAQPDIFLSPYDRYVKAMAELTDTPQHHFSKDSGDTPAGSALRALEAPLIAKCEDRQDRYEATWRDVFEFAMWLLGYEDVRIDLQWAPLMVVDDADGWGVVQAKINTGVPAEVALTETGYPAEQVQEWVKDANGADLARRIMLLNQIGTAVQTLGAGIALGAASKEQVQEVVSRMLGLTLEGTEINLPKGTFMDPTQVQQQVLQTQQEHQTGMQQTQLDHATQTQQASQDHQRQMAQEAADRAKEMFGQGGPANRNQPPGPNGGPPGRNNPRDRQSARR